jgi:hypothetical protein
MNDRTTTFSDRVDIDMWYTSSDHRSVRLVEHLAKYADSVKDMFDVNIKIVSMQCGDECTDEYKRDHCLSGGKYCDMHSNKDGKFGA